MNANQGDSFIPGPIVHVRSLGEFEYCPRAGIIAFENQGANSIDEETTRIPNLGYSPILELAHLNEEIGKKWARIGKSGFMVVAFAIFAYAMGRSIGYPDAIPPWLITLIPGLFCYAAIKDLAELCKVWAAARRARPMQLLHELPRVPIEVDWWELVKVYQVGPFKVPYKDSESGLVGKANRILTFENHRIPVILSRSRSEKLGVRPTHKIKLAAYARLISIGETGSISNWGIVIFAKTRKGYAIPIDSVDKDRVVEKLRRFRQVIDGSMNGRVLPKPHESVCRRCPNNVRRVYKEGVTETKIGNRAILPFTDADDKTHCDCGDRFQWTPPLRFEAD